MIKIILLIINVYLIRQIVVIIIYGDFIIIYIKSDDFNYWIMWGTSLYSTKLFPGGSIYKPTDVILNQLFYGI